MATRGSRRATQLITLVALSAWPSMTAASPSRADMDVAVRNLGADHDRGLAAVYELQAGGGAAAAAIRDGWASMSPLAKKRAITALRSLAHHHDTAIDALVEAAHSAEDQLRELALEALLVSGPRGRQGMVRLLSDDAVGDRAAVLLARSDPESAVEPLLAAMARTGGADRSGLRDAFTVAVQRAASPRATLLAWLRSSPPFGAVASAALGLSAIRKERDVLASFVEYGARRRLDFAATWRLLRSAGAAGKSVAVDQWVERQLREADAWMLRAAAIDAVTARGRREAARKALADPYPRVRARASTALAGDADTLLMRARLARKDVWPTVRAAAVTSLRSEPRALPVVIAAVDDSMSVVRAAAIDALTDAPHDEGWDRIRLRLRAANEWPKVTAAAIEYAAVHCRADAMESLFRVVMRAARSNALTEDLNNAARAIEALRVIGTPEADAVIERLRATPEVPPTLKMALDQPVPAARCPTADH